MQQLFANALEVHDDKNIKEFNAKVLQIKSLIKDDPKTADEVSSYAIYHVLNEYQKARRQKRLKEFFADPTAYLFDGEVYEEIQDEHDTDLTRVYQDTVDDTLFNLHKKTS